MNMKIQPRLQKQTDREEPSIIARGKMLDQAVASFLEASYVPRLHAWRNAGSGKCGVSMSPDCENGMQRTIGSIP